MKHNSTLLKIMLGSAFTLLSIAALKSQTVFEKSYGSSSPDEVCMFAGPGQSGSIMVCGYTYTQPEDAVIARIDNNGVLQWAKKFGGTDSEWIYKVRPTSDGGYIACGYTMSTGAGLRDGMLVKMDASGSITWTRTYGTANNDYIFDVRQTSDGGYIATGTTNNTTNVSEGCILLLKTTSNGTPSWSFQFGQQMGNAGKVVIPTSDGGYLVAASAGNSFFHVIKFTSTGTISWARNNRSQSLQSAYINDMKILSDGSIVVIGAGNSMSTNDDIGICMMNSTGVVQWWKRFSSSFYDYGLGIVEAGGGGLLAVCHSNNYLPNYDNIMLLQLNKATGAMISAKTTSSADKYFYGMEPTSDGAFVFASTYGYKMHVGKVDGAGFSGCATTSVTPTENTDTYFDVAITNWTSSGTLTAGSASFTSTALTLTTTPVCNGIGIEENNTTSFDVYPNPAKEMITINIGNENHVGEVSISVSNILGETIFNKRVQLMNGIYSINTSTWNPGMYLISCDSEGIKTSRKVVIE